jgi:ABC-type polysaccharide/polyol phosphate transport system ATPase subunit
MTPQPVLKVENISKSFRRYSSSYGLKDVLLHPFTRIQQTNSHVFTSALKNISFELFKGESLAVLGTNGAGKSTLLSILAGIIQPSSGRVETCGRIGLMLELGSGFCYDLSGRENIELNGLLLGESRCKLKEKMDEIIDFSGIREFIDEPLRVYSTGMQARLGFAIAAHIEPTIMLIDEILAVGDSEFQRKCLIRLREMQKNQVATVLVTHSLEAALQFCEQAIYLDKGEIRYIGQVNEVVDKIKSNKYEY